MATDGSSSTTVTDQSYQDFDNDHALAIVQTGHCSGSYRSQGLTQELEDDAQGAEVVR